MFMVAGCEPVPVVLQLGMAVHHDHDRAHLVHHGQLGADEILDALLKGYPVHTGSR